MRENNKSCHVLFVCHGNICRSPMAEFVLKDLAAKAGLADHFVIASAATSTEEIWNGIGNPVYPPAREEMARHGISCAGKRAVQLKKQDYDKYDYLIGMDSANIRNMKRMLGGDPEHKIYKMMEFAEAANGGNRSGRVGGRADADEVADVADPWYTRNFEATWRDVTAGCAGFLKFLKEQGKIG